MNTIVKRSSMFLLPLLYLLAIMSTTIIADQLLFYDNDYLTNPNNKSWYHTFIGEHILNFLVWHEESSHYHITQFGMSTIVATIVLYFGIAAYHIAQNRIPERSIHTLNLCEYGADWRYNFQSLGFWVGTVACIASTVILAFHQKFHLVPVTASLSVFMLIYNVWFGHKQTYAQRNGTLGGIIIAILGYMLIYNLLFGITNTLGSYASSGICIAYVILRLRCARIVAGLIFSNLVVELRFPGADQYIIPAIIYSTITLLIMEFQYRYTNALLKDNQHIIESESAINEELRSSNEELIEKDREVLTLLDRQKELFAIVGHELRTPLASMKMLLDDPDHSLLKKNQMIRELSSNLLEIVDDIRYVVSPDQVKDADLKVANPSVLVRRTALSLSTFAGKNDIDLQIRCTDRTKNALFATTALRQITTNLIKNAIVHSGGSLVICTFNYIANDGEKVIAELRVEDDGKGIPEHMLEHTFEPFGRGDTEASGTGLGLYVAQCLAETLNGKVEYETSKELGGACFIVTMVLELDVPVKPAVVNLTRAFNYKLEGKHVLMAEDDKVLQMLTQKKLEKAGCVVTAAPDGQIALDLWRQSHVMNRDYDFDFILTDMMMPNLNGPGLIRALREEGYSGPIIGVTAAVVGTETGKLIEAGANDFISKPIDIPKLIDTLTLYHSNKLGPYS